MVSIQEQIAPGVRVSYDATRVLHRLRGARQEKVVIDNAQFGRMLMIDGVVQLSSADEFIYHEMMAHVPLLAHGAAERVLIIGGGDGGLAREVLRHPAVRHVVQVEIDEQVVTLARTSLGRVSGAAFEDPRLELHIGDGAAHVASTRERFDAVLVDGTDPGKTSGPLYSGGFHRQARACLRPGGLLVALLGSPVLQPDHYRAALAQLAETFPLSGCYLVTVPSIFGGPLAFGWASDALDPRSVPIPELGARLRQAAFTPRCYTPALHHASFVLPRFLQPEDDHVPR